MFGGRRPGGRPIATTPTCSSKNLNTPPAHRDGSWYRNSLPSIPGSRKSRGGLGVLLPSAIPPHLDDGAGGDVLFSCAGSARRRLSEAARLVAGARFGSMRLGSAAP